MRERAVALGLNLLHSAGWLERPMRVRAFQRILGNAGRIHAWRLLGVSIEDGVRIGPRIRMHIPSNVRIGTGTSMLGDVYIDAWATVTIGRNVLINDEVLLLTASHDVNSPSFEGFARPITIGDHAWLPHRIVILPGVSVGAAAVVGTGAVVARDVAPYTVVAGNPARVVSRRVQQQYTYVPSLY